MNLNRMSQLAFTLFVCVASMLPTTTSGQINLPGDPSSVWDSSTLHVIESNNLTLSASQSLNGEVNLECTLVNGVESGFASCTLESFDGFRSVLIECYVNTDESVDYITHDTDWNLAMQLWPFLANSDLQNSNQYFYCSTNSYVTNQTWGEFWEGYWYYLTNPSEMDDDLETGFYVAVSTSAVAFTAAGGFAIAGVNPVLWGGTATVAGGGGAGTVTLTEGGGVIGWVHGGRIVTISAPNTSHAFLGTQAGVVVEGAAVEGAYAFTAIKSGGQVVVVGSQNFGGVSSIPTFVIEIVKAVVL